MYPFRAVIVGSSEAERTTIRRDVTNLSVGIEYECDDMDQAIGQRPLLKDAKCFFLVKVNSSANMDQLARLNQVFIGKPIVALLNGDSDLSAVLHIQRAGAAQVLLFPFHSEDLRAALATVARQFGCATTSAKVIAVLGASEGCGSTTLAINLSDAIASAHNKSCILVELSLHLGRLGFYLDIEPSVTVSDLLAGSNALEVSAVSRALVRVADRFQVVVGPHHSVDRRAIAPARVLSLLGIVRQMAEVVILDMPYTFDDLYFDSLYLADEVVMVAQPTPPSIGALKVVSEAVAQRAIGATQHLVINCYGPRAKEFTETQLRTALAAERIWTIANDPAAFEAAVNIGQPLHQKSPTSRAWPGITALARDLIGLDESIAPKRAASWPSRVTELFRRAPPVCDPALPIHEESQQCDSEGVA
jgi:pilus assembly protein CpaE